MLQQAVYFVAILSICRLDVEASPLSSSSPSTVNTANALRIITPSNSTRTSPLSLNARPPEPLVLTTGWPESERTTVAFSKYSDPMFKVAALRCVIDASRDAWDTHGDTIHDLISKSELVYRDRNVIFTVFPRPSTTWKMFYWMMELIDGFVGDYESLAFEFEVIVAGVMGLAASGNMTELKGSASPQGEVSVHSKISFGESAGAERGDAASMG